jgi:hypothetical protein
MTKDDIIKWAQQWGDWNGQTVEFNDVGLERFAALVAAAEREVCAGITENWRCNGFPRTVLADQIRARGQG